jgi:hypothetical protein
LVLFPPCCLCSCCFSFVFVALLLLLHSFLPLVKDITITDLHHYCRPFPLSFLCLSQPIASFITLAWM